MARRHVWQIGLLVLGLGMMGIGVWQLRTTTEGEAVQVVETNPSNTQGQAVVVEVAGAVLRPGVYRFDMGARVADALKGAGGLAPEADDAWVAKMINQAEIVKDGIKIYIPAREEQVELKAVGVAGAGTININTASVQELDSLWGIGSARAQAIVSNRPYGAIEELVSKAKIPTDVLEKNREKLSLY